MKSILFCDCGSPRLSRSATVSVNSRWLKVAGKDVTCDECAKALLFAWRVDVPDSFNVDHDWVTTGMQLKRVKEKL